MEKKKLIQLIKKTINRSTVLPIMEDVHFIEDHIEVSDLENFVRIPFKTGVHTCTPADMFLKTYEMMKAPVITRFPDTEVIPYHFIVDNKYYLGEISEAQRIHYNQSKDMKDGSWQYYRDLYPTFEEYVKAEMTSVEEVLLRKTYTPNWGVSITEGKRKTKLAGENPMNYPLNPLERDTFVEIGAVNSAVLDTLDTALRFVSNDDLRPAMTGIYFDHEFIVSTDAHRLFHRRWEKIGVDAPMAEFILPPKAARLLCYVGGDWTIFASFEENTEFKEGEIKRRYNNYWKRENNVLYFCDADKYETWEAYPEAEPAPVWEIQSGVINSVKNICFYNAAEDISITTRVIDARFPDFRAVIPQGEGNVHLLTDSIIMGRELKNAAVYANRSTNQVIFSINGDIKIHSEDVDFSYEYDYEFESSEAEYQSAEKLDSPFVIGFNGKFLQEILKELPSDEVVRFKLWTPTKGAIINDEFLVMPLMLNRD